MPEPIAYHSAVHALEGQAGWTPERRFASAVLHAIDGHLPYARFVAAGIARQEEGISHAAVERRVRACLATDVNPLIGLFGGLHQAGSLRAAFHTYQSACGGLPAMPLPSLCRTSIDAWLSAMLEGRVAPQRSVTALATLLGLEDSAAADVARVFEREGSMPVAEVAARLGCQRRTLERQLQRMGVSAEAIRQACRLAQAALQLGDSVSLTRIAIHAGYADTPHMARAFRRAAGLPPSALRRMLKADSMLRDGA